MIWSVEPAKPVKPAANNADTVGAVIVTVAAAAVDDPNVNKMDLVAAFAAIDEILSDAPVESVTADQIDEVAVTNAAEYKSYKSTCLSLVVILIFAVVVVNEEGTNDNSKLYNPCKLYTGYCVGSS